MKTYNEIVAAVAAAMPGDEVVYFQGRLSEAIDSHDRSIRGYALSVQRFIYNLVTEKNAGHSIQRRRADGEGFTYIYIPRRAGALVA